MSQVVELLNSKGLETWIVSLLHSLWLGMIWMLVLWAALRCIPGRHSRIRYGLACGALVGLVLSVLVTCAILRLPPPTGEPGATKHAQGVIADAQSGEARAVPQASAAPSPSETSVEAFSDPTSQPWVSQRWMPQPWRARALPVLTVVWLTGCVLMLFRTSRDIMAARSLIRGDVLDDPAMTATVEVLSRQMGVRRPIALKLTSRLTMPAVWGLWKPVILLPASLLSNLTPQEVEAILAHELAHIRRWDLAVDLLQRLIESLFFFNPAVWWISRQIRLEREVCCDIAAASITHGPARYAAMLVDAAERLSSSPQSSAAVMAMKGPSSRSSSRKILDRARRLLTPQSRPEMQVSWGICLLMVVVVGTGLFLLQRGTDVAVAFAAEVLSDEKRVQLLAARAEESTAAGKRPDFEEMTIVGEVQFAPDVDARPKILYSAYVDQITGGGLMRSLGAIEGARFETTLPAGMMWLFFQGDGVAPAVLGPFDPGDGPLVEKQTVVLRKGVHVPVLVVDERGVPAPGVKIAASVVVQGNGPGVDSVVTDGNGMATLEHAASNVDYSLSLSGPGYQPAKPPDGKLTPGEQLILTVSRALPATGAIVDESGQPVSGVKIKEFLTTSPGTSHGHGMWGDVLAVTDERGQFTLDQLEDGKTYYLLLEHDNFAPAILSGVHSGDKDLRGVLRTGLTARIAINDHTGELADQVSVNWHQAPLVAGGPVAPEISHQVYGHVQATSRVGQLTASIRNVRPGELHLSVEGRSRTFEVTAEDSEVVFDYTRPPEDETRRVRLSFTHDGNPVRPAGRLRVYNAVAQEASPSHGRTHSWVPVTDGVVSFSVLPPAQIRADSNGLIGFWFSDHGVDWPRVEAGDEPLKIAIPVRRAGAVRGEVRRPDGSPAASVGVGVVLRLEISADESPDGRSHSYVDGQSIETDADGKFFVTPIPLGARYVVAVSEGFYRQVSDELVMSAEDVLPSRSMTMHEKTELTGRVVDPDGNPARGVPVSLHYDHPLASQQWGPPQMTDAQGRFVFAGVNSRPSGEYTVTIEDRPGIQPVRYWLDPGEPNLIELEKGLSVSGRVLDELGRPVRGVEVYAMFEGNDGSSGMPPYINADDVTDAEGRFHFTTLPDLPAKLHARQLSERNVPTVQPDQAADVTIQGDVVPWHLDKLKAQEAGDWR